MDLSKRIRFGAVAGILALGLIVPAAVVWAQPGDEGRPGAASGGGEGLVCFEVDDPFRFPGWRLGRFGSEGWPPFGWFDPERPRFEPEDSGGEELPRRGAIIERLNAAAEDLADYLDDRGIEYELETGPFGVTWVIWDPTDTEADRVVEEFLEEHGGMIGILGEVLPLDPEGMKEMLELPDLEGLLEELDLEGMLEELDLEGMLEELDLEGLLEELDLEGMLEELDLEGMLEELPFGEGFLFGGPFHDEFPFDPEELPRPGGIMWRDGLVCLATIQARADGLAEEAHELAEVLESAGIDVDYETIEVRIPVWDEDAEGVDELLADFYGDRRGRLGRFGLELGTGVIPFFEDDGDEAEGRGGDDDAERDLRGFPLDLERLIEGLDR